MLKQLFVAGMVGLILLKPSSAYGQDLLFGYILRGTSALDSRDVQLGYDYLAARFAKHYNTNVKMVYDPDGNNVIQQFIDNDVYYLGMHISNAAPILERLKPHVGDIMMSSPTDDLLERYVVLTNDFSAKSLTSFKGKRAAFQEKEANAYIYADILSIEQFHTRYNDYFKVQTANSAHRAILMLYFNQADITFVPLRSWETAKTLNPAIARKITPLLISAPVFGYGVELYHDGLSPELDELKNRSNNDLTNSEEGKQLLRIMKVKKRIPVSMDKLRSSLEIYFRYENLLKEYRKGRI